MTSEIKEIHFNVSQNGEDAIGQVAVQAGLSKQVVKQAMHKGALWLTRGKQTRRLRRIKQAFVCGDQVHLYYNPEVLAEASLPAELIADEGSYSVWAKPYGMLSQGSKWGDHTTVNRYVELHLTPQRSAFITHRLDKAATGLIILAHSKKAAAALSKLFASRALTKCYEVIVEGEFPVVPVTINTPVDGKVAISHAERLDYDATKQQSLVKVKIDTGRKHQIRIHMASLGHPVVGDRLHGNGNLESIDLQLASCYLSFECPLSQQSRMYELPSRLRPKL